MAGERGNAVLVENLFRQESGRLLAALTRILGMHNLAMAEDLVQETLITALEVWKFGRVPENPTGWLVRCARNRAIDAIRRERVRRRFADDVAPLLDSEWTLVPTFDHLFSEQEIADGQLRMMFACCSDKLSGPVQVALILKILCGFSIHEIAAAHFTSAAAVEKQIVRAKRVLQEEGELAEIDAAAIRRRLETVQQALYLLFNEGYHTTDARRSLPTRQELTAEALRLTELLAEHPVAGTPQSQALHALICLHAARLAARVDDAGQLVLLEEQDRTLWDRPLIERGLEWLDRSSTGDALSEYHLEAAIAAEHCIAARFEDTHWSRIVGLYDALLALRGTPVVALNRAIAVGRARGPAEGLQALAAIDNIDRLADYPFLYAARADLLSRAGDREGARRELRHALELARHSADSLLLEKKLSALGSP